MDVPTAMYAESLRDEQVKVLRPISPIRSAHVVRGQMCGYHYEPGVAPSSQVETYAALRLGVNWWCWNGVSFLIRTGKSLPVTATEVMVKLQQPPVGRLVPGQNYFRFRLGPELSLNLGARVKKPGLEMTSIPVELSVVAKPQNDEVDAYEPCRRPGASSNRSSET